MSTGTKPSDKFCPNCQGPAYVDNWRPGPNLTKLMYKFICSDCGAEFYMVITDPVFRLYLDRQLSR